MRFVGIDPSTKTGFVALDSHGNVLRAKELTGVGSKDPKRMVTLIHEVMQHIKEDDYICIEGFSYGSKGKGIGFQFGLGYGIRNMLFVRKINCIDVSPGQLKKFGCGKGNAGKDELAVGIYKNFGFEHSSDNVRDAYVLAQIGRALKFNKVDYKYQKEVIEAITKSNDLLRGDKFEKV